MAQYIYTMNRVAKMVPPKRFIIEDISLSFFPGAKIGVLGLNGSGKSTLLNILGLLDTPTSGEYWLADTQTSRMNDEQLANFMEAREKAMKARQKRGGQPRNR